MQTEHGMPHDHDPHGYEQRPGVLGLAVVVTLGVIPWLYGIHVIILGEANTWAGHIAHTIQDGLLAFPLAVLAVGVGRWLTGRWGVGEASARDRIGQAAIIALAFAICLVPATGAHQFLDRFLDGNAPGRIFHGHGIRAGLEGATDLAGLMLHGIRDAMVGLAAAFPVTLLGVALASARRGRGETGTPLSPGWASPARLAVPAAVVLAVLGLGVTALTFVRGEEDPDHARAAHPLLVTTVPAGSIAEVDGLRITTRSARWVRHAPASASGGTTPAAEPDRLYMEFSVENRGEQTRTFGRKEVRVQAPSGKLWGPLADDFPPIRLGPQEALTTMLIFEVPAPEAGLQLAWARGDQEVRIPIGASETKRTE